MSDYAATAFDNARTFIRAQHVYSLAAMIEGGPQFGTVDGPGANFLTSVQDAFIEWLDYLRKDEPDIIDRVENIQDRADEDAAEQTDACVPVYTYDVWRTFVDLGAWGVDTSDYAADVTDMTKLAMVALAIIAEQLFGALATEFVESVQGALSD